MRPMESRFACHCVAAPLAFSVIRHVTGSERDDEIPCA